MMRQRACASLVPRGRTICPPSIPSALATSLRTGQTRTVAQANASRPLGVPNQAGGAYSRDRPGLQHLGSWSGPEPEVDAAYEWARQHGDEVLDEPQIFPQYHPRHFAAYWVEPHGFKIEVVSFATE